MKVLVACEYSGVVRDAFTKLGHYAVSCDLLPLKLMSETKHHTMSKTSMHTAAYTFVAVAGLHEIEKTIYSFDEKTARREFWKSLTDDQQDSTESVELVEVAPITSQTNV